MNNHDHPSHSQRLRELTKHYDAGQFTETEINTTGAKQQTHCSMHHTLTPTKGNAQ